MMQNIQAKQAGEKWSLHQYSFTEGSRKIRLHSLVVGNIGYKVQRKQSLTSAGSKSDGPNIFFKNRLNSESFFHTAC